MLRREGGVFFVLLLAVSLLAGCTQTENSAKADLHAASANRPRPTVVALIDTGINPYHDVFRASSGGTRVDDYLDLTKGAELVHLSGSGDLAARRKADAGFWDHAEMGKLYAFSGT